MGRITMYTQKEIKKLKGLFKKYKEEKSYTLKDIASDLKRSEWSVRDWLRKLFGDKYTEVSSKKLVRSIEKVSDEELKILFQKYKMGGVYLSEISEESKLSISELTQRFLKLFGDEYTKAAEKKFADAKRKGTVFEEISLAYLKYLGFIVKDVRKKSIFEGSPKRPDFLIDDKFVEVKAYAVQLETFGYFQGYKEIVDRYIGKQLKDGKIITSGMIISLLGFSPEVRQLAEKDQIELIGPLQLKQVFRDKGKEDLIKLMCTLN